MKQFVFGVVLMLMFASALFADEKPPPSTLRELVEQSVEEVQIFRAGDSTEPAKPLVALRWANNVRGSEDGMTVLYIHDGLPITAACVFPLRGNIVHELGNIGRGGVVASRKETTDALWHPPKSGIDFATIPGAPTPEDSAANRLRQLKSLAEQFSAVMVGWDPDDGHREELRLLPRPLFRYEPKQGDVIDGAVFAFVTGTDPEALLLIEAVKEGDGMKWQYGFARRTTAGLEGRHRDKLVWTAERRPDARDPRKPVFSLSMPIPPELLAPAGKE